MTTSAPTSLRFQRHVLPGGARLSVLPTKKLKTFQVKAFFAGDLNDVTTAGTQTYDGGVTFTSSSRAV